MRLTKKAVGSWLGSFPCREEGVTPILRAGERRLVGISFLGKVLDASLTVVVTAWQDLWLLEVILADWARNLLF